jgi:RNA polymerase sigma factor (sigma-70 family)
VASGRADAARHLQTLFSLGTSGGLTDGELLERFASRQGVLAEAAFAALVERHGPAVLRVCHDILENPADAEDAFQATFLVLVRRAGSIRNRESVASWLYGVALRVAGCARSSAARRRKRERKAARASKPSVEEHVDDLGSVLHDEVGRLPEEYRAVVVLCYWEGLTHEQAADRLRWPVGTVRSRLSWARRRLRVRLIRRGLAPAVALAVVESARSALAVPIALAECTVQGGVQLAAGQTPVGVVSGSAWMLTQGVLRTMMLARGKVIAAALLTIGMTAAGTGSLALQAQDAEPLPVAAQEESPSRKSEIDQKIDFLKDALSALRAKIQQRETELSQKLYHDLIEPTKASPDRIWVDESRRVRESLFETNMKLIEAEALLKSHQDAIAAIRKGADPEALLQKPVKDALRDDPESSALTKTIEKYEHQLQEIRQRTRSTSDPSFVYFARKLATAMQDLRDLSERKGIELAIEPRNERQRELKLEIDALKTRKSAYEKLIREVERDPVEAASVRDELAGLKAKEAFVKQWIEQLQREARAARPR